MMYIITKRLNSESMKIQIFIALKFFEADEVDFEYFRN